MDPKVKGMRLLDLFGRSMLFYLLHFFLIYFGIYLDLSNLCICRKFLFTCCNNGDNGGIVIPTSIRIIIIIIKIAL